MLNVSVRLTGKEPEIWDAVTGGMRTKVEREHRQGRTVVPMYLYKNESLFLVFRRKLDNGWLTKGGSPILRDTLQEIGW